MLPAIGVMIGLYVLTRMVELLMAERKPPQAVALLAFVTILGTVGALLVLLVFAGAAQGDGIPSPFHMPSPTRGPTR